MRAQAADEVGSHPGFFQVGHHVSHHRGPAASGCPNNPHAYAAANEIEDALNLRIEHSIQPSVSVDDRHAAHFAG
ncbi:hypothetical protein StoSoilB5_11640 [Arthrobacter sp. StoSoilB5]|nr:hypothetical protein StoSoilB5_11640 [Arthrobacter sp. StoSoilB5]